MAKINVEINKAALYLEHYFYTTIGFAGSAAFVAWKAHVSYSYVFFAFIGGLLGPLIARVNSKSAVNAISADTNIPAQLVQNIANVVAKEGTQLLEVPTAPVVSAPSTVEITPPAA